MAVHAFYMAVVVRIGFQHAQYTVSEASTVANIRIEVLGGSLEREIIVCFSTSDSTAIGKCISWNRTFFINSLFQLERTMQVSLATF